MFGKDDAMDSKMASCFCCGTGTAQQACYTTLLLNLSSVNDFALVQNAIVAFQQSGGGRGDSSVANGSALSRSGRSASTVTSNLF